jgi:hypothetical protein
MRLGDPENSRAVLVGASTYAALSDLPAVRRNLVDLRRLLTDPTVWGLPEAHCVSLSDVDSIEAVLDAVHDAADNATDTLLVYYAGHGLLDQSMNLRLALPASDPRRMYRSLQYDDIRQVLRDAVDCPSKVVILDSCFSGRAVRGRMMGRTADIADQAAVEGSWLVTASAEHAPAMSPPNEPHTAFTGELIRLLDQGIENGPEFLDVDTLYLMMHKRLKAKDRPEPQQRIGNHGRQIVLAKNRWYTAGTAAGRSPRRLPGPPDALRGLPTSLTDLTRMIDDMRRGDDVEKARSLLQVLGRHRETQEVAATLAYFFQAGRTSDIDAVLDGVAVRRTLDCAEILDVLGQIGANATVLPVLDREGLAPAERVAELFGLLAGSPSLTAHRDHLFDVVVEAALGRPDRVIDVVSSLLLRKLSTQADRLVDECRTRASDAEVATIADSLRDAGREKAAFRLYPAALDVLAARLPDQIATLALGLRRHGGEKASVELAEKAAVRRRTAADRADLIVAFESIEGLHYEVDRITDIFAGEQDDSVLEELPAALRERGANTVDLYLAVLEGQPVKAVLDRVHDLVDNGRPLDVIAILKEAGATRSATELDTLTAGLVGTPEGGHQQRIYAAMFGRKACTVELYQILHCHADGRFRVLRAELISQPPLVLFDAVVHLMQSAASALGEDLLRFASAHSSYPVTDELIEYADQDTAEILVLAAVGLPDLRRIVHALRRKGFLLEYRSHDAARLLLRQPEKSLVVVVSALCTAESGLRAASVARRLTALPVPWVAYLLEMLIQPGDGTVWRNRTGIDLDGPESELVTAREILAMAATYDPGRAFDLVAELHNRGLKDIISGYLAQWVGRHPADADAFLLAAGLDRRFGPHLSSRVLQNRGYLPERCWSDPFATAVSEVLHKATVVGKEVHRFPVPPSITGRLRSTGVLADSDYCLLVIESRTLLGKQVVFTEHAARYGTDSYVTYLELARVDQVAHFGKRVWLTKDGVVHLLAWTMRSDDEASSLADLFGARTPACARGAGTRRGAGPEAAATGCREQGTAAAVPACLGSRLPAGPLGPFVRGLRLGVEPGLLRLAVGPAVGVFGRPARLGRRVFVARRRHRPQVVAHQQGEPPPRRARHPQVQVDRPARVGGAVQPLGPGVAGHAARVVRPLPHPPGQAGRGEPLGQRVRLGERPHGQHQVDHVLGRQARHRGRADVRHLGGGAHRQPDAGGQPGRLHRPRRVGADDPQLVVGLHASPLPHLFLEGAQPAVVELVDPGVQLVDGVVVGQQHVGGGAALDVGRLRGDPRGRLVGGHPPRRCETADAQVTLGFHDHHQMVRRRQSGLDQERDVVDHDRVGGGADGQFRGPLAYAWMDDLLKPAAGLLVAEDHGAQGGPVEGTVVGQHGRAEGRDDLGEAGRAGRHRLAGQRVRIDQHGAVVREPLRHRALARTDPAGEPHLQHRSSITAAPVTLHGVGGERERPPRPESGRPFDGYCVSSCRRRASRAARREPRRWPGCRPAPRPCAPGPASSTRWSTTARRRGRRPGSG